MHLPIFTSNGAVFLNNNRSIMIETGRSLSKSDKTITTPSSFAKAPNESVEGPGIVSA